MTSRRAGRAERALLLFGILGLGGGAACGSGSSTDAALGGTTNSSGGTENAVFSGGSGSEPRGSGGQNSGGSAVTPVGGSGGANSGGSSANSGGSSAGSSGAAACSRDGDDQTTLVFVNDCSRSVTYAGSDIASGSLAPGKSACVNVGSAKDPISSKRYWGFAGEDPGSGRYTLAEFTFNTDFNDFDWYDISYVDAHNLPMQIVPLSRPKCKTLTCAADFLVGCPDVGKYRNAQSEVVACVSPSRDDPNSPVARYFESCDDAYAWSGDDQNGADPSPMRACAGEDWQIVFCPAGAP